MNGEDLTATSELAGTLSQLRKDADISGRALAGRLGAGFSQSKVSRILAGKLVPTPLDAGRLGFALGAPPAVRRRLIQLAAEIARDRSGLTPIRVALSETLRTQERIAQREKRAEQVITYHSAVVPGLLQTERYLHAVIASDPIPQSPETVAKWVRIRLERQDDRASRPAVQIVSEGALWWGVPGAEVMAEQCERIAELTLTRPNWRIGVIPRLVAENATVDYPPSGFDLHYGPDAVIIGTTAGNAIVTDRYTVRSHVERLARLESMAVFDDAARDVLQRVADEYRQSQ